MDKNEHVLSDEFWESYRQQLQITPSELERISAAAVQLSKTYTSSIEQILEMFAVAIRQIGKPVVTLESLFALTSMVESKLKEKDVKHFGKRRGKGKNKGNKRRWPVVRR